MMNIFPLELPILAGRLRATRGDRKKPVFWLGAGCSKFDGIPMSTELLALAVPAINWGSPQFAFDRQFSDQGYMRGKALSPYMAKPLQPDSPYLDLAWLLRESYIDVVFTFNIDHLLEDALLRSELLPGRDYRVVDVPMTKDKSAAGLVELDTPRIRIVKLHGGYETGVNYMTSAEIFEYDPEIVRIVKHYSRESSVVCGYSFFHLNVLTSFSSTGDHLYYANPSFPDAPMVISLLGRRGTDLLDGKEGRFESFMKSLRAQLGSSG